MTISPQPWLLPARIICSYGIRSTVLIYLTQEQEGRRANQGKASHTDFGQQKAQCSLKSLLSTNVLFCFVFLSYADHLPLKNDYSLSSEEWWGTDLNRWKKARISGEKSSQGDPGRRWEQTAGNGVQEDGGPGTWSQKERGLFPFGTACGAESGPVNCYPTNDTM